MASKKDPPPEKVLSSLGLSFTEFREFRENDEAEKVTPDRDRSTISRRRAPLLQPPQPDSKKKYLPTNDLSACADVSPEEIQEETRKCKNKGIAQMLRECHERRLKKEQEDLKSKRSPEVEEEEELFQTKPKTLEEIHHKLTAPLTSDVLEKYFNPYADVMTRCHPLHPGTRYIHRTHVGRMKQLVEFFPEGIAVDHFLHLYREILGNLPTLNGYTFPKDDDPNSEFKLRRIFWIPDNDAYHVPQRLLFPVKSFEKYFGTLYILLHLYWNQFLVFMNNSKKKAIWLNYMFDFEDNYDLFFAMTGIWFSYKQWGLESYVAFFEILVANFDRKNEMFTILLLPPDELGSLRQRVFLVTSGVNGCYARAFEEVERKKFSSTFATTLDRKGSILKWRPPPQRVPVRWEYRQLNFTALRKTVNQPFEDRLYNVVAAGNIWNFCMFFVIFVEDIDARDTLLEKIHNIMEREQEITVPLRIFEKCLVVFPNRRHSKPAWRRGLVMRHNKLDETVTMLDIDTGETNLKVPVTSLRNLTQALVNLPVLAIPVRFSVSQPQKKHFIGNAEGNRILGKYLHMMLVEANRGLRLRFHWWDPECTSHIPGVWVVTGFLIDILKEDKIKPRVSLSEYLLDKFEKRDRNEILPEWEERNATEDDGWSVPPMRQRHPSIRYMINYLQGRQVAREKGRSISNDTTTGTMSVPRGVKQVSVSVIHQDKEYGGREPPVEIPKRKGIRRNRCRVDLTKGGTSEKRQVVCGPELMKKLVIKWGARRGYVPLTRPLEMSVEVSYGSLPTRNVRTNSGKGVSKFKNRTRIDLDALRTNGYL